MVHLVSIHGASAHPPSYVEPFAQQLSESLQEEVLLRPIWYGDLTRDRSLRTSLTPAVADVVDMLRYAFEFLRRRLHGRVREAFRDLLPEKTLLVTHSWGSVVACNMVPHDSTALWVMFGSRPYVTTRLTEWPRVARWHNFWSPRDPLSSPWVGPVNHEIPSLPHSPMWTNPHRAQWVANIWSKDG